MRMTRINKISFYLLISIAIAVSFFLIAQATSENDIVYPAAELGNCPDKAACFAYCDDPENRTACVNFARKHNLLPPEELARAEKFEEIGGIGPGGCNSHESCEAFCNDITHIDECVAFGEENGFLTGRELEEAKKVKAALDRGIQLPAGCTNKESCEATCEQPRDAATARSCFAFAKDAGLLPPEFDDEKAERMFSLIDRGEVDFKKMRDCEKLERGEAIDEATLDTCMKVAVELGFMKEEEKQFARQMMLEGGPDGCRGKACKDVCENNPEKCLQYFEEKGIALPAEAQERIKEGLGQMQQALSQAPPEVLECLTGELGADVFESIQNGTISPAKMAGLGPKMGTIMQGCFAKGFGGFPGGGGGGFPGGEFPGGDEAIEQCMTEAGLSFPPTAPPTADQQKLIQECITRLTGGEGGFPGGDHEGFPEGFPGPGGFPGAPGEFPGGFPEGEFDYPEGFPEGGFPSDFDPSQIPGGFPTGEFPEGFVPSEGHEGFPEGVSPEQFQEQFQQQYDEQYQQQYQQSQQEEYRRQCEAAGGVWAGDHCETPSGPQSRFNPPSLLGFFAEILGIR